MKTIEERFWSKVNKNGPVPPHCPKLGRCWVWIGSKNKAGYGQFSVLGKQTRAHHYLISEKPKSGQIAMHKCDNPPCVNPLHIRVGTQSDNMQDCKSKGRLGDTIFKHATSTHCPHGHEFTEQNTYWYVTADGRRHRYCKECSRLKSERVRNQKAIK